MKRGKTFSMLGLSWTISSVTVESSILGMVFPGLTTPEKTSRLGYGR